MVVAFEYCAPRLAEAEEHECQNTSAPWCVDSSESTYRLPSLPANARGQASTRTSLREPCQDLIFVHGNRQRAYQDDSPSNHHERREGLFQG